jgi:hypothetical protein
MSLEEARTALKYEGLYNFLQRPCVLRIQLRRIASKLGRVQLPDTSWDKLAAQEQRLEIRKYLMKTLPTIRSAYADMTAFADNVNEYISTICKEQDQIPEQLLKRYQSADDQHKTKLAKELFAQGMSMEDRRMLTRLTLPSTSRFYDPSSIVSHNKRFASVWKVSARACRR